VQVEARELSEPDVVDYLGHQQQVAHNYHPDLVAEEEVEAEIGEQPNILIKQKVQNWR